MRTLGIIPAKGSSSGVENKNMRKIAGEPLIAYALGLQMQHLVLMTDDTQIAAYAKKQIVGTVHLPRDLALGPVVDASRYALISYEEHFGTDFDTIVLLQPDSPIRTPLDIDNCLKMLEDNSDTDGVISVYKVEDAHPAHMYELGGHGYLIPNIWDEEVGPRQILPPIYHRNGAIYAVRRETLMNEGWIPKKKLGYVMPRELSLTIDTEFDLLMAERQVQLWKEGKLTKTASSTSTSSRLVPSGFPGVLSYEPLCVPRPD